jgi:predicted alpha/beta-fold hydrolase
MSKHLQFRQHWGLSGPHRQTVIGALLPSRYKPAHTRRHIVTLEDDEQLYLFENGPSNSGTVPIVLVHGLGGTYQSGYLVRISAKLAQRGMQIFRVNLRGCAEGVQLAQKTAHAGCIHDLANALEWIQQHSNGLAPAIAGFSLGGNILLKLLTQLQQFPGLQISRAVAVAPPVDLDASCQAITKQHRGFYDRSFLRSLRKDLKARAKVYPDCPYARLNPFPRTLREFDDRFTAPLNGFQGARDYYQKSSSKDQLDQITTVTSILIADDDPVVPAGIFEDVELSASTTLLRTRHGGHLGYLSNRLPEGDRRWMDWKVIELLLGDGQQ